MAKPPTKAERDARKAFRPVDAKKAMTEHEIAQMAFSNNRERLKAERLAREAAGAAAPEKQSLQGEGEMTSIELKPGDRVRLNELGASRSPKIRVRTGTVVTLSSRSASVGVLFDGNKRPTTIHRSYVQLDEEAKGK
jgi:hypothetical protein